MKDLHENSLLCRDGPEKDIEQGGGWKHRDRRHVHHLSFNNFFQVCLYIPNVTAIQIIKCSCYHSPTSYLLEKIKQKESFISFILFVDKINTKTLIQ